jgi:hypothetical protein
MVELLSVLFHIVYIFLSERLTLEHKLCDLQSDSNVPITFKVNKRCNGCAQGVLNHFLFLVLISESRTPSAKCSYNDINYSCALQRSNIIGSTVLRSSF